MEKKLAAFCVVVSRWVITPAAITTTIPLISKSKQIIKTAIITHSIISFGAEYIEHITNLAIFPIDLALFGQPIPVGVENRFNLVIKKIEIKLY